MPTSQLARPMVEQKTVYEFVAKLSDAYEIRLMIVRDKVVAVACLKDSNRPSMVFQDKKWMTLTYVH